MPLYFIPVIYTTFFAIILIATVPQREIRRLSIYGIIFGAIGDVLVIISGKVLKLFEYINYEPLGFMGIPFFAPLSWSIFFVLYFYFLPKRKPLIYVYIVAGIGYSILFGNLLVNLGIMKYYYNRFLLPLITFSFWFPTVTWGYYKLTALFKDQVVNNSDRKNKPTPIYRLIRTHIKNKNKLLFKKPIKLK